MVKVVYPGTFDPVTHGHLEIIRRACSLFSEVVVGVVAHTQKKTLFSQAQRLSFLEASLENVPGVLVRPLDGLLIDFVKAQEAHVVVRGLRSMADFEYERQLSGMNHQLDASIETVFLMSQPEHAFVSSSLVREVAGLGGLVRQFVPAIVATALEETLT